MISKKNTKIFIKRSKLNKLLNSSRMSKEKKSKNTDYKVAVYGTLMKGLGLHHVLKDAKSLGTFKTTPNFYMYAYGSSFPYIIEGGSTSITMEVYSFPEKETLATLDRVEGVDPSGGGLYNRTTITTPFGEAFVYTKDSVASSAHRQITSGSWQDYINKLNADNLYIES